MTLAKHFLSLAVACMLFAACKKDKPVQPVDTDYFPLSVGQYRIYDVDSIKFYDVTLTSDTFHFQIKENIDSSFNDGTTTLAYFISHYRRATDTSSWNLIGYASEKLNGLNAERMQNNERVIKMVFPVALGQFWKGNKYLNASSDTTIDINADYSYTNVDTVINYQSQVYPQAAVVTQRDDENAITKDIEREVYAHGIGLVCKNSTHVERQHNIGSIPWIPEKGTIVTYKLREHN